MRRTSVFFWFIALYFLSCEYKDTGTAYFEVEVDKQFIKDKGIAWIVLQNQEGAALDVKELANGTSIKFYSPTPELKIGVTLIYGQLSDNGYPPYFSVKSYLAVNSFAKWTIQWPPVTSAQTCGASLGDLKITINDTRIGALYAACISNTQFFSWPDPNSSNAITFVFRPIEIQNNCDNDYFLYVMGNDGIPRYKFLEDATTGNFMYTLNDFKDFDNLVEISYSKPVSYTATVNAFESSQSVYDNHITLNYDSEIDFTSNTPSSKVAYLDKYSKYTTSVDIIYEDHRFNYDAAGGPPTSIDLPQNLEITVTNKNFADYSFTVNQDFDFSESFFNYFGTTQSESSVEWTVYADNKNTFKNLSSLPKQFLDAYPGFHIEKLLYGSTKAYTRYKTMDQYVAEEFQNSPRPETYTYIAKSVFR